MWLDLILISTVLSAASGVPGLLMSRTNAWGQRIATGIMLSVAVLGLTGAVAGLFSGLGPSSFVPWPSLGGMSVGLDPLSAFFLVPVFLMGGAGSIYGTGYWSQKQNPGNGRRVRVFWGLLVAGLAFLVIARHMMAFLLGWEIMALAGFFLVTAEDDRQETRRAGLVYLIATHISTLILFGMFALWRWATGSFDMLAIDASSVSPLVVNLIFILSLVGFGIKAGMMPLHFWLPGAHAAAPSHVSAMLSGVVLKMGVYGMIRFMFLLPHPPAIWGGIILALGAVSGLLGVVWAIGQHDLKRLLAYHSIENIGIILMGLGLALLGRSQGEPAWIVLGMSGCLLHVWNHGIFKSLLFFGAGSVVHATNTREIDAQGGLAKSMPWTSIFFLVGAVAICGLPPLNGFISELFVYMGLLDPLKSGSTSAGAGLAIAIVAPILAMIGALAVACFVKVYATVFLGQARTPAAQAAHECPVSMRLAMAVPAIACLFIGLFPAALVPLLDNAIWSLGALGFPVSLAVYVPVDTVGIIACVLVAGIGIVSLARFLFKRLFRRSGTWDCGYAVPTARMQYTASSFAQMIVNLFAWVLKPKMHAPVITETFPGKKSMHTHVDDAVLDRRIAPALRGIRNRIGYFRKFQHGLAQYYMLYILIAVAVLLATLVPFGDLVAGLFAK
ncbi:MAG: hydrogenase [Spirochaetaceae bacterium]|nr:MAG: hydrogenase [Spirochaetaceae bacterium]